MVLRHSVSPGKGDSSKGSGETENSSGEHISKTTRKPGSGGGGGGGVGFWAGGGAGSIFGHLKSLHASGCWLDSAARFRLSRAARRLASALRRCSSVISIINVRELSVTEMAFAD